MGAGYCRRCGRKLTSEASINLGLGPGCYRLLLQKNKYPLFELPHVPDKATSKQSAT